MAKYLGIPLQVASGTTVTPTYGSPELVVDGDFPAGTTAWQAENAATFAVGTHEGRSNVADINVTASSQSRVKQPFDFVNGVKYQITVEVYLVSGTFRVDAVDEDAPNNFVSTTTTGLWQTLTGTFTGARTNTGNIFLRGQSAAAQFYVDSISIKEVPYVLGKEQVVNGDFSSSVGWVGNDAFAQVSVSNNKIRVTNGDGSSAGFTSTDGSPTISVVAGKTYRISYKSTKINSANELTQLFASPFFNNSSTFTTTFNTDGVHEFFYTASSSESLYIMVKSHSAVIGVVFDYEDLSVKEVQYNYLQVVGGDLLKESKVGDVVFNSTDDNEAVVLQVIDNDTLLLSNDILSDEGDAFSIFAPNGDTRGNQILRIDNYIISEYDEATSAPNQSSFWFAAGTQADKVTLTQLNDAVNTYFVADVIERFVQRLNAQSATASRLDIPLNEFRDHKYNQVLTTTAITLS